MRGRDAHHLLGSAYGHGRAGAPGKEEPRPLWDSARVPVPLEGAGRLLGRAAACPGSMWSPRPVGRGLLAGQRPAHSAFGVGDPALPEGAVAGEQHLGVSVEVINPPGGHAPIGQAD